ncbi:hypothetical protein D3C71_1883590 [compost metagenome]
MPEDGFDVAVPLHTAGRNVPVPDRVRRHHGNNCEAFLAFRQPFRRSLFFGDVATGCDEMARASIGTDNGCDAHVHPVFAAVLGVVQKFGSNRP